MLDAIDGLVAALSAGYDRGVRRRWILLGSIVLALTLVVAWWRYRAEPRATWEDDIAEPEPGIATAELRFERVLVLTGDSSEREAADLGSQFESFAVFDRDYLWLSDLSELTRVPRDGGPITKISVPSGILPGSVGVVGDHVLWVDLGGEGRVSAFLYGVPRSLDQPPSVLAELGSRWAASAPRPLYVGGYVVLYGVHVHDDLSPESQIAIIPVAGGEPEFHRLDTGLCNDSGVLTSVGDAVVIACSRSDPYSAVYEIDIPSLERRVVRRVEQLGDHAWYPHDAVAVDDAMILVGDAVDGWGVHIKRLHSNGQLQTITTLTHDEQTFGVLRGDGQDAFYYCRGGACGSGRLFWLGAQAWAELPNAPRDAFALELSAGVLHWRQREGEHTVLYANTPWPNPPLRAEVHNPNSAYAGVYAVRWGSSATPH